MEYPDVFNFSWRNKEYLGDIIMSKVRDQTFVGSDSCPQHSVGSVLEMQHWRKLQKESRAVEKKEIHIKDMFKRYSRYRACNNLSESSSTKKLLSWLETNVSRAEDGSEVFQLKGHKELRPLEKMKDLAYMLEYLLTEGPFVGVFNVRHDFDPGGNSDIYLCQGRQLYFGVEKPMRHAVAVVGFGIDKNMNPFWEYLESVAPCVTTPGKSGFGRVVVTGFDRASVVHV